MLRCSYLAIAFFFSIFNLHAAGPADLAGFVPRDPAVLAGKIGAGMSGDDIANLRHVIGAIDANDREAIVDLASSLCRPGAGLIEKIELLNTLKAISPRYVAPPFPPMKQQHIVELLKSMLDKYPSVVGDYEFYCQFINTLATMPSGINRLMAARQAENLYQDPILDAGEYINLLRATSMSGPKTLDEFYEFLDTEMVHINRKKFVAAKLPDLPPTPPMTGDKVLKLFNDLVLSLELDDENNPGYLSIMVIDDAARDNHNNHARVQAEIEKTRNYLRALYAMPLTDVILWYPKAEEVPYLKRGIEVLLNTFAVVEDPSVKANNLGLLMQGLLHCPTGQKEGIDTVIKTVIFGDQVVSTDLAEQVKYMIATRAKEQILENVVRQPEHRENTHISTFYKQALTDELGLFNSSAGYQERTPVRTDKFEGDPNVVLALFYFTLTPERLAKIFMDAVENEGDKRIKQEIEEIQKQISKARAASNVGSQRAMLSNGIESLRKKIVAPGTDKADMPALEMQKKQLESMLARLPAAGATKVDIPVLSARLEVLKRQQKENLKARPISIGALIQYLTNLGHVVEMTDTERNSFFPLYFDKPIDNPMMLLTLQGAHHLCVDLGYIVDNSKGRKGIEARRASFAIEAKRRKKEREINEIKETFVRLEKEITPLYARFKKEHLEKKKDISRPVLFLDSLRQQLETLNLDRDFMDEQKEIACQILAILTRGVGVGGFKARPATRAERTIMENAFKAAYKKASPQLLRIFINHNNDLRLALPVVQLHEQILWAMSLIEKMKNDGTWDDNDVDMRQALLTSYLDPREDGLLADIKPAKLKELVIAAG